ncbi:MAG: hypothetical protein WD005_02035 [Haliea sp.]
MAIRKQEFYEGAALYLLARAGEIKSIRYNEPFFIVNNHSQVLLKYSTRGRSPWGFTFTPDEQMLLQKTAHKLKTIIGLICGADGIAAFTYADYLSVAAPRSAAIHIACYRHHRHHYEVNGPDGTLAGKVAPSDWRKILEG